MIRTSETEVAVPVSLSKRGLHPTASAIVNGASFRDGHVSPGSLATIFDDELTFALWSPEKLPIESPNFATKILIAGGRSQILAPPAFVSPNQFHVQIPNLPPSPARLRRHPAGSH